MKIALYKGTGFVYSIIKFVTRGEYVHSSIVYDNGKVLEAKPFTKVALMNSLSEGNKKGMVIEVYDVPTTPKQEAIITEFLTRQLGKSYDYLSLIGFVTHTTEQQRKTWGKWFCSELCFAAFRKGGIDLLKRIPAWEISPSDLSYSPIISLEKIIIV